DPTEPIPYWEGGAGLASLPPEAVNALIDVAGPGRDIPVVLVELRRLGGAMARPAPIPNAVSGRGTAYSMSTIGLMVGDAEPVVPGIIDNIVTSVEPWRSGHDLFNLIGPATPQRVSALWSPADRARLVDIKRRVDPAGMFGAGHKIT